MISVRTDGSPSSWVDVRGPAASLLAADWVIEPHGEGWISTERWRLAMARAWIGARELGHPDANLELIVGMALADLYGENLSDGDIDDFASVMVQIERSA